MFVLPVLDGSESETPMAKLKIQIRITMALGVLSFLAALMAHLALTDIYHGEEDVTLEWSIVRTCACLLLVFLGAAMWTLYQTLGQLRDSKA
jgi:protein-S-isoprenylcysteine O-methyltransferase Ste14